MAFKDVLTKVHISSNRLGHTYEVYGFTEYSIDADMETDSDSFHLVLKNPGGKYNGMFNKYDTITIGILGEDAMHGKIDEVEYYDDGSDNVINIVGRDDRSVLIDNDALPCTKNNVDPVDYLRQKLLEYGVAVYQDSNGNYVPKVRAYGDVDRVDSVVIGCSESELGVISNMLVDTQSRIWQDVDYICIGDWDTGATTSYYFSRGTSPDKQGIPIDTIQLSDNGADVKSEVQIYGTMDDGKQKVLGTATNPSGRFPDGIPRRKVIASYTNDKNTKYSASALRKVRDAFRSGINLTITANPQTFPSKVWINKTARIIDVKHHIDGIFFIKAVNYTKSVTSGSVCTIKMVPGDITFDVLWENIGTSSSKAYIV